MSLLDALNPQQREAAEAVDGPVLIFAGAGSGKTRALTYRIAHMVRNCGIPPDKILAVTFTNKAAGEMKERIRDLVGPQAGLVSAGTFHSMCARMLRADGEAIGIPSNFVIYDEGDQQSLVKQALHILDIDPKQTKPNDVLGAISAAKNELVGVQEFSRTRKGPFDQIVQRVYRVYQEKLRENNALDFDDLLMRAVQLLRESPETLDKYQERWHYLLVDEYQDINHAQYVFISKLAEKRRNICVVGDDDQSIYGWRGANVGIILAFEKDYPEAKVIKLEQNYRSTQKILECAYEVIRHNQGRADKKLWTQNRPGDNIIQYEAVSGEEEAEWLAESVQTQVKCGMAKYGDYAVLYRTNAMSRAFEEELMRRRVPYEIVGGIRFYERAVIKDFVAYLRVIYNPDDGASLRRIINVPARGIGDKTVAAVERMAFNRSCSVYQALRLVANDEEMPLRARHALQGFWELIERLRDKAQTLPLMELCRAVAEDSGYLQALEESGNAEDATKAENLREFVSLAQRFAETGEGKIGSLPVSDDRLAAGPAGMEALGAFLDHIALISDIDQAEEIGSKVSLMTLHAAKGLEFPVVFMVGMEEGMFPHQRCLGDEHQLAEERRLCYVGMTRAQSLLHLSHAARRTLYGQPTAMRPSRFLRDLPEELVDRQVELDAMIRASSMRDDADAAEREVGGHQIDLTEILSRVKRNRDTARQRRQAELEEERRKARRKADGGLTPSRSPSQTSPRREQEDKTGRDSEIAPTGARGRTRQVASLRAGEFRSGDRVKHAKFGTGLVIQVAGEGEKAEVTVAFPKQGVKRLALAYAPLEKV